MGYVRWVEPPGRPALAKSDPVTLSGVVAPQHPPSARRDDEAGLIDVIDLAGGRRMVVRTTTVDDAERICALYDGLDRADRQRRFFGSFTPRIEWCRRWACIGERGGFGVLVLVSGPDIDGDEVVAEAGYALRADGDGDLAITVATPWRGWLGAYLLDVLVRQASSAGLRNLQAEVLLENGPMLSLLCRRDPVALGHDDGVVRLSIGTGGTTADWPPNESRPRILIEVAGRRWSGELGAEREGLATTLCAGPDHRGPHACPVLEGGTCPLADGADVIVVLLDPDDERTRQLIDAHHRRSPETPILVRHRNGGEPVPEGCAELDGDGARAVAQLVALVGRR
jgi:hypothetical protein